MEGRQSVALELHSLRLELSAAKRRPTGPQKPVILPRFDVEFTANSITTAHPSR
jgi:hypothetical protein